MLGLDDAGWAGLTHAYGEATDTPGLLRRLADAPEQRAADSEPFFSLWSSLCHQGDVYTASYAAVPHLAQIALTTPRPIDFAFFLLPASIEVARHGGRGPEMPPSLAKPYDEAIASLPECAWAHRKERWSEDMMLSVAAAEAVARGHHKIAEALMNLDDDWIEKINNHDWE
jgi:hypothetical protein